MAPRVTIGVPVYNGERYLGEALASAAGQTGADIEVLVLDNASTDATADIAQDFVRRDARFHYRRHATNIGPVANYNALVGLARAPLFKWLPADDRMEPGFIQACVAALDADPRVVLATTRLEMIGIDGEPLPADPSGRYRLAAAGERVPDRPSIADLVALPQPVDRFRNVLYGMFGMQISTYMYGVIRTDVLRRTGLEGAYPGGDKVLLAELVLHGPFREVPQTLWGCRIHPQHLGGLDPAVLEGALRGRRSPRIRRMRVDQLLGYLGGIRRAPIGWGERAGCVRALVGRGRNLGVRT
jgi:glycosyltransferase involved in cell wall biosynthesis